MSKWYPKNGRVIFHVDMNSFYASVEMSYNRDLKGKAIAIAGNPGERRGIVVTSSYEARKKGVKTTMPLWEAKRLCPELVVIRPNFDRYQAASREMFTILSEVTSLVEPVSIDEGYMDITACQPLGSPLEIAEQIQRRVAAELDLPCSIGIAPNKFLAKMASDMRKPMGITVLRKRELSVKLWPLPIGEMYGVGAKTAEKLANLQINTIGDLVKADVYQLKQVLGINGELLQNRAKGIDPRVVDPESVNEFKSIGSSETLPYDTVDEAEIKKLLRHLAGNVQRRMKRRHVVGKSIQIMIRYHDRKTITRSMKLPQYVEEEEDILTLSLLLFNRHWNQDPVRLLGITIQDIAEKKDAARQLDIFTYEKETGKEKLYQVMEHLTERYGKNPFIKMDGEDTESLLRTSFQKDFLNYHKKGHH